MSATRFAVYFVPAANTGLYRFGAAAIGYDCYGGADLIFPAGLGWSNEDWSGLTREPRQYGFHATLKAPFRLREGADERALIAAFDRFAEQTAVAPQFVPQVRLIGGFVAIVPRGEHPEIRRLADACVSAFEPFRAPLSGEERDRRLAGGLDDRQIAALDRWGYPYVFDQFRFHMTLTGSLPGDRRDDILSQLQARFAHALGQTPIAIDRIALSRQERTGERFRVVRHAPIGRAHAGIAGKSV